jgi:hypothetical protein
LAENVDLRHVYGAQDAHFGAAGRPHRPFKVQGAPDAVDIARITAEEQMGRFP